MCAPKVFISHASEDKAEYAELLGRALRAQGIDAWLDKWELVPGDNLVQKVFEEGLGRASTVVFLMSTHSVDKPWARAELENAVVRHIEGELRLIPVKLEECSIPQSVRAIFWIDLAREGSIELVADRIVMTVFGQSEKPPLGEQPAYMNASTLHVQGLERADELVLSLVFEVAMNESREFVQGAQLMPLAEKHGLNYETVKESTEMLAHQGYVVDKDRTVMGRHIIVELPATTMIDIAQHLGLAVGEYEKELAGLILNEAVADINELKERMSSPPGLTEALLDTFEYNGFLKIAKTMGGGFVHGPTVAFKRWFRNV